MSSWQHPVQSQPTVSRSRHVSRPRKKPQVLLRHALAHAPGGGAVGGGAEGARKRSCSILGAPDARTCTPSSADACVRFCRSLSSTPSCLSTLASASVAVTRAPPSPAATPLTAHHPWTSMSMSAATTPLKAPAIFCAYAAWSTSSTAALTTMDCTTTGSNRSPGESGGRGGGGEGGGGDGPDTATTTVTSCATVTSGLSSTVTPSTADTVSNDSLPAACAMAVSADTSEAVLTISRSRFTLAAVRRSTAWHSGG